ncbi:MAG TPA: peptide ABC transporter substrate-binding protein [Mycobacteriales bacterium]|nr:peptide ABC transporter substrate-binding protein [Mycobacteriales bacterium]
MLRSLTRRTRLVTAAAVLAVAAVAGCSGSSSTGVPNNTGGTPLHGGTASLYNIGGGPNYIFPLASAQYFLNTNLSNFQMLMYRPLYWYGNGNDTTIDYTRSIGKPPVYSNGNKTVTISLNHYVWSDGTPVSARDVLFWHNLMKAEKANWADYSPGDYPDNVASAKIVNPTTIQFNLTKAYDTNWFTYNELSQITPLPQQAWDKKSANGSIGDWDETTAGAKAVYNYLAGEAKKLSTYASNPLWQTVDGPWRLTEYTPSNGNLTMVPNPKYVGHKPYLAKFTQKNYTTTDAEFNALLGGNGPDIGFISPVQLRSQKALDRLGYVQGKQYSFSISYQYMNFNNPTVGPMFKQLYIRQVLQLLQNQEGISEHYYSNTEVPGCGPIPSVPQNSFADETDSKCLYGYDPQRAISLLKAHGWNVVPNGVSTCQNPGTAANQCGANIPKGAQLKFTLIYENVGIAYPKAIAQEKSDAAAAGVDIVLKTVSVNDLYADTVACKPSESSCDWQLSAAGGWIYAPDYYPTGEALFQTGAGNNLGSYSDPKADQLIEASTLPGDSKKTLDAYQDYLSEQLPVIWQETGYSLIETKSNLKGTTPYNIFGNLTPEDWYYTGHLPSGG